MKEKSPEKKEKEKSPEQTSNLETAQPVFSKSAQRAKVISLLDSDSD